jgi:hypothetical protein
MLMMLGTRGLFRRRVVSALVEMCHCGRSSPTLPPALLTNCNVLDRGASPWMRRPGATAVADLPHAAAMCPAASPSAHPGSAMLDPAACPAAIDNALDVLDLPHRGCSDQMPLPLRPTRRVRLLPSAQPLHCPVQPLPCCSEPNCHVASCQHDRTGVCRA